MHLLTIFASVFGIIFILELPDKTMFATILMTAKARPLAIFIGASSAFVVHMVIAVVAGRFLTELPHTPKDIVLSILFFAGAAYLLFVPEKHEETEGAKEASHENATKFFPQAATAFGVIFVGEFGDLSQIQTASLVTKLQHPLVIFLAASLALVTVTAIGSFAGSTVTRFISMKKMRFGGGLIFIGFGVASLISLFS
jgi:putative Ca2+/H+ antiporter (TMEM165/GDT1 family)